jgi:hypothetical protein
VPAVMTPSRRTMSSNAAAPASTTARDGDSRPAYLSGIAPHPPAGQRPRAGSSIDVEPVAAADRGRADIGDRADPPSAGSPTRSRLVVVSGSAGGRTTRPSPRTARRPSRPSSAAPRRRPRASTPSPEPDAHRPGSHLERGGRSESRSADPCQPGCGGS